MNAKKSYKLVLSKKSIILILVIYIGLNIIILPDINKGKIITLSASSGQNEQAKLINMSPEQGPQPAMPAPVIQKPINPSVNGVTQAAVKLGILSCISRINQVSSFLSNNNQTGVFIFTPQNQPDQHVFSTSFELIRNDDSAFYASANFFPNQDAVYETVEYVEKSCEELEKTVFSNLTRISVVKKNVIVLNSGAVKVFLMPAGSGTIVIKKEVIQ